MQKQKNVLMVTLFDNNNIGNRLQHYALQRVLTNYGMRVASLNNGYTSTPNYKYILKMMIKAVLAKFGIAKYKLSYLQFCASKNKRKANEKFNSTNIKKVINITNQDAFAESWKEFDLAIAGSDQIWHKWRLDENELPYYYLEFMPKEKRCAYAASFGFETIPAEDLEKHKTGLNGMHFISCRESTGCEIVESITGEKTCRVLDPTLLLSATEWREIAEQAPLYAKSQTKYAFLYFLGDITEEYRNFINKTLISLGIVNVIDFSDEENREVSQCGPSGFLSLIDRADYIFTDSFHCTVFSVIFDKNFQVFRRSQQGFEKMFGRIEDLLSSKGLLNHIYGGTTVCATNNFDAIYKQSIQYLETILEV